MTMAPMKGKGIPQSSWKKDKEEGFASILGKLVFMILVYGLLFLLILEKAGGGIEWISARFPILKMVRDVSPLDLYIFWLVTLWLGYKIGKQAGTRGVAARERKRLGIPF
jgi:hypothetical protein